VKRALRRLLPPITLLIALALLIPGAAQGSPRSGGGPAVVNPPGLPQTGSTFGAYIQVDCTWTGCTRQAAQLAVEGPAQANRMMALDRQFYTWDDAWPTEDDTWSAQAGRTLVLSWDPLHSDGTPLQWIDVANGVYDATIDAQATKIKAFPYPFFFVFHHEPANAPPGGGSYGTPDQFIAAWRHVHDRFVADGVTNVRYLLVLFAWTYKQGKADLYYPGDQWVDLIGADGYNWYLCGGNWSDFTTVFQPFYNYGLQVKKPMLIAEWGSGEDPADPNRKANWITNALTVLKGWPEIKGIAYYDSGRNPQCLRWINTTPQSLAAFVDIGDDPYLNPAPDTTAPVTSLDAGPPSQTVSTSATFAFSANELGVRYTCSLDGAPATACYDFAIAYSGLAVGVHTFSVKATDYSGNVGNTTSWTWSVVSPTLGVTIKDTGFTPKSPKSTQGRTTKWTVSAGALQTHQVTDSSGMGLFESPVLSAGQSYSFTFIGAGAYRYKDKLHTALVGIISVPVGTFPLAGGTSTSFTITWASAAPATNYVFDVQIKRPGGSWTDWKTAVTFQSIPFVPDSGAGTYSFRARYHNNANGKFSSWSTAVSITVS
jgi:plastocyanin